MDYAGGGRKKSPALWAEIYKSNIFQDLWITPEAGEKETTREEERWIQDKEIYRIYPQYLKNNSPMSSFVIFLPYLCILLRDKE